ncbi:TonB-dependent receptor [bacterium]|nr:TonB-dependent receptor [bacterium]
MKINTPALYDDCASKFLQGGCMNIGLGIKDLSYLESVEHTDLSGGYVSTTAYTSAGSGYAIAYGNAAAWGQQTYTNTNAITLVQNYSSSTKSYGKAIAKAYSSHNSFSHRSSYRSTSIYYSGH